MNQSAIAQYFEMVRDRWLTFLERQNEVTHAHFTGGRISQDAENPQSHRVGERGKTQGELFGIDPVHRRTQNRSAALVITSDFDHFRH
jgi:hypothetical protein